MDFKALTNDVYFKMLAGWKLILSSRKREWSIEDYPVIIRKQQDKSDSFGDSVRYTTPAYVARVVNWWTLSGTGGTAAEALQDLKMAFERSREEDGSVPRPGKRVPLKFAADDRIAQNSVLTEEFIREVLGTEWALITDESSLWHFTMGNSLEEYYEKIQSLFGLDVTDIKDGNIAAILERVTRTKDKPPLSSRNR
jgi:hypothetical protein